jgi:2-hydroxycyclohexanecarboxyl-CoA dehydrogenase
MDLQDRAIIVTGGASGIGRATALLLAREGAKVLIGDVDAQGGRSTVAEGAANHVALDYLPLDLTINASVDDFVAAVHQRAERVDGLVNAAGWDQIQPFLENPPEMWDRVIAVNLMGAIRLTGGLLPPMVEARAGKIVNISSDAGRVGSTGETVYAAAKGGLIAFTKSLAREMARYRINVKLRVSGSDRYPFIPASAGAHEGSTDPRYPVPPDRPADRNRSSGAIFLERTIGLRYRPSAERQRRADDGRLIWNRRKENAAVSNGGICRSIDDRVRRDRDGSSDADQRSRGQSKRSSERGVFGDVAQQSGVPQKTRGDRMRSDHHSPTTRQLHRLV